MDYACIQEKDYTPETNVIVFSKVTDTAWFCNRDKLKKKKKKKKKWKISTTILFYSYNLTI